MKRFILFFSLLLAVGQVKSQVLLGYSKDYVQGVSRAHTDVTITADSNSKSMITWKGDNPYMFNVAYFFTNDVCNVCMMECDYTSINAVVSDFNSKYEKNGDMKWIDHEQTDIYITILRNQAFYIIMYSLKY